MYTSLKRKKYCQRRLRMCLWIKKGSHCICRQDLVLRVPLTVTPAYACLSPYPSPMVLNQENQEKTLIYNKHFTFLSCPDKCCRVTARNSHTRSPFTPFRVLDGPIDVPRGSSYMQIKRTRVNHTSICSFTCLFLGVACTLLGGVARTLDEQHTQARITC